MDNKNKAIFPTTKDSTNGLSKREYFAAMAMNGYCVGKLNNYEGYSVDSIARWSVSLADALLKELEK
jgi:hypothetical protein